MIKQAQEVGGTNPLYVDTVKEFAGHSLANFKHALTAIQDAGLSVISEAEWDYNYYPFIPMIEVMESLESSYVKNRQIIMTVAMFQLDMDLAEICEKTGLAQADVFQAVTDYKREQERKQE